MGVVLKPHNEIAYQKVEEFFQEKRKVAVIEPPSTGKSFVALKCLESRLNQKSLLLVPTNSIMLQYKEHIKACGYEEDYFYNLEMMTYDMLYSKIKCGQDVKADFIILDEFHRCGAKEWEKGVRKLLEINQESQILGLSATPIRYLDKNRNMSDELFDGNVAFQMDLIEAVARRIVTFPFYISGIYQLDETIKQYEKKIEKISENSLKKSILEKLEIAKRKLEKSTSLEELFSKYIRKQDGKYIIFCKDKKHMEMMKEKASEWFSKVNEKIDIYSVYYKGKNNQQTLKDFYHANNSHLKILYCIDMLNEGFHDPNIDGVIMLRPTLSPILFIQQLGRALAIGDKKIIVFDIVNNIRSCQDIRNFIDKVMEKRKELGLEEKIEDQLETFQIIAEMQEEMEALNEIEMMLQSWTGIEYKISLIEEFYQINKRLPFSREQYKGVNIGRFLTNIKAGIVKVSEEQMERLLILGLQLESREEQKEYKINLIETFYQINGRLPCAREQYKGVKIGRFLANIKVGKTRVTKEQMARLCAMGFRIETTLDKYEYKICLIEEFYGINKRLPYLKEQYKGVKIGAFLVNIKAGSAKITEEQMVRLCAMGFQMEIKAYKREYTISLIEEFYQINERLPQAREEYKEVKIGRFLQWVKNEQAKITEEQMARLYAIGFRMETKADKVEYKICLVEEFYQINGRLPKQKEEYMGVKIGAFLNNVKAGSIKITEEQWNRLINIDYLGALTQEEICEKLEQFYNVYQREPLPGEKVEGDKYKAGNILVSIRGGVIRLRKDQIERLQKGGFSLKREKVHPVNKEYVKKIR